MKLIPSFIQPTTHFYVVPLIGPDRAAELSDPHRVPMIVLDPMTDEWYGYPVGKGKYKTGPYGDQQQALEAVREVIALNEQVGDYDA